MPLSKVNRPGLNTGIDDNSDATAITINSSERVGISHANPSQLLSVGGDSSGAKVIQVTNSVAGTAFNDGMQMFINDSAGGLNMRENYPLQFYVNGSNRMTIDASGRVTMPNQPVYSASDSRTVQASNTVLTSSNFYNQEYVNVGNHMNTSNGNFTCPVAGVYRIYFRCTHQNSTCNVRLQKNGSTINEAFSNGLGTDMSVSSEAVVSCAANDTLRIQVASIHANGGKQHKQVTFQLLH